MASRASATSSPRWNTPASVVLVLDEHDDVLPQRQRLAQSLHRAVGGDEGDALPHAALRAEPADVEGLGPQAQRAGAGRPRAEQQVRQFLGPGADEAGHAEDLPGADLERQVAQPLVGQVLDRPRSRPPPPRRVARGLHRRQRQRDRLLVFDRGGRPPWRLWPTRAGAPTMRSTSSSSRMSARDLLADDPAVPEHDDAVGDRAHRRQVVRDEQHRRPLGDDGPDQIEEPVDLLLGQEHGGLVEDEHRVPCSRSASGTGGDPPRPGRSPAAPDRPAPARPSAGPDRG